MLWLYLLTDFILFTVLICTASRNSIITLVVFLLFIVYYCITNNSFISRKNVIFIKGAVIITIIFVLGFGLSDNIIALFIDSNRMSNFTINIPLLEKTNRLFIGLGLVDPGSFGAKNTTLGYTYYIDNYYLYIFMETGILGLIMMGSILCYLGVKLHKHLKKNNNLFFAAAFFAFIAQLISGLGETNVIYHIFPSSFILLILYLLILNNSFESNISKEEFLK